MFKNLKDIFTSKKENTVMTEIQEPVLNEVEIDQPLPEAIIEATQPENLEVDHHEILEPEQSLPDSTLEQVEEEVQEYSDVYSSEELLNSPLFVGWTSTEEQELLFSALLLFYSPELTMLDVGCARADLFGYCYQLFGQTIPYKGIDYNPNILNVAQQKYPGVNTEAVDILNSNSEEKFDWVVGSGLFNLKDAPDMQTYTKDVIQKMYEKANLGVAFNLLTGLPDNIADEDREQLVVHDPAVWLDYLIKTYTKVIFRTDYLSGDGTFFIFK